MARKESIKGSLCKKTGEMIQVSNGIIIFCESYHTVGHLPPISPSISWDVANPAVFRLSSHFTPKAISTACTLRWCCIFYACSFLTPLVILFSTNFCPHAATAETPTRIPQDGNGKARWIRRNCNQKTIHHRLGGLIVSMPRSLGVLVLLLVSDGSVS